MKLTYLLLSFLIFISCQSESKSIETSSEEGIVELDGESNAEEAEAEPEDFNVKLYQSAKKTWETENNAKLPDSIDLTTLYRNTTSLLFGNIVNKTGQYILTHFSNGTDVENNYYATFDMNGQFLDAILYETRGYGDEFTVDFIAKHFISVKHVSQQGFEIDEYGDYTYDHTSIRESYIYINEDGYLKLITTENEELVIADIDASIFDYYQEKIKNYFPDLKCDLYPFNIIPGDNTSSNTDVYESLEGGGLYAKCLEVRNEKNNLIGVIGYRTDINKDGTPTTFSFVISDNQQPIIQYGIVSIDGLLHLKLMKLLDVKGNMVQATINFYNYPLQNEDSLYQKPVHNTINGYLSDYFK